MKKITKTLILMLMMAMLFAVGAYASGEPSDEPVNEASAEPAAEQSEQTTSKTTIIYGGQTYVLDVYEIDGVQYVKLADAAALLEDNDIYDLSASGEASAEPSGEIVVEASAEPSGEIIVEASEEPSGEIIVEASEEPSGEIIVEASEEPSGEIIVEASDEPSGEPVAEASGEPSVELADQTAPAAVEQSVDVTIRINGVEYQTAAVGITAEDDTYTFQISALLDILGLEVTYDEQNDVAYLSSQTDGLLAALLGQAVTLEQSEQTDVQEPIEEVAPAQETEETAVEDDAVPATDGTENQQNVLESTVVPETEDQFEAYKTYLTEFMTAYTGTGDGTFDDGARDMALNELSGVSFGADVSAFPFEMFVTQFGALDYGAFAQTLG